MVHNTWLNAFYWGGALLFLAVSVPLFWALRVVLRSQRVLALCSASYVILINLKFPAYLITYNTHEWILACLALGIFVYFGGNSAKGDSHSGSAMEAGQ